MAADPNAPIVLSADGFNELRMCRHGPMLYNRNDHYVGGSLSRYGEFSHDEVVLFEQIVRPGAVVVEAGANVGAHTVALSRIVGASGQVHAYEPQRIVFQALCANLALNQCTNVFARQAGAGAARGSMFVPALDPRSPANFGGVSLEDQGRGERVDLVPIDDLDLPACHMIKADVEGMELDVVRGAERTIRAFRPLLYLENDRDERSRPLLDALFALDYALWWHLPLLYSASNHFGNPDDVFPGVASANVLGIPREARARIEGLKPVRSADEGWRDAR